MKIKQIKRVGKQPVYDITVKGSNSYALSNGVVSHNSGLIYVSDSIVMLSKSKDKDKDKNIIGNLIKIKMFKSRLSKENSEVEIKLSYSGGLDRYYGLLEMAEEAGMITVNMGKYNFPSHAVPVKIAAIEKEPEKFFTDAFLKKLDKDYVIPTFSYGMERGKELLVGDEEEND